MAATVYVCPGKVKCFATLVKITAANGRLYLVHVSLYLSTLFSFSLSPCLCMSSVKQIAVRTAWHPSWQRVIWQQRRKSSWKRKTLQFGNWQAIVTDRDCMPSMASPIAAKASRSQPLTASLNLSGNRRQSAQSPVPCSQFPVVPARLSAGGHYCNTCCRSWQPLSAHWIEVSCTTTFRRSAQNVSLIVLENARDLPPVRPLAAEAN